MHMSATTQSMSGIETIHLHGADYHREFHKMPHTGDILCISRDGANGTGRIIESLTIDEATYDLVRAAAIQYRQAQDALAALTLPIVRAEAKARRNAEMVAGA